ncbi:hypothetical protein PAMC26510_25110 [Caballeronia sordidicola]|uniref:Uncharacterized protein n=1 Tax=Caballeronia sordidicola TaxID=196367 RepID=A0A242MHJ0_CABSO|nr:hypothetical protein PAMC26510_25110 [Caballeronia sordidicola]
MQQGNLDDEDAAIYVLCIVAALGFHKEVGNRARYRLRIKRNLRLDE